MQHNTDTLYSTVIGGSSAALAYFVGGVDHLITALGIFMAIDYLMGLMIAVGNKTLSSEIGFKGLMKKAGMILAVIVAVQLDLISGTGGQFMRNTMIMFLIGMEGISIIENLGHLGVKVPKQISSVFAQLKEDNEKAAAPIVKVTTETTIQPEEQEREAK
ncbi:holin [Domibacillus antri]|uniref:Holin n=1 Tax=Domibacillus antri TaxID=1714264 RepID=A0A1Q8Q3I0_9BACI|nr:phage holin family protein [Domibacillus antri]OLN21913.1 holin [Domibacillus antri]